MFVKKAGNIALLLKIGSAALSSRSTRKFYDRIAPVYDRMFVSHKIHCDTILKILDQSYAKKNRKISLLDLGCGTGLVSILASDRGFKVTGLDISFCSLRLLKKSRPQLAAIQAEAAVIPAADHSFDAVVCLGALRHFHCIEAVIAETSRVLTRDGIFIAGYFPPDAAGLIAIRQNILTTPLIRGYHRLTGTLGYLDRIDQSLEVEIEQQTARNFKTVYRENSGATKHLLVARHPLP
ncbi:class I SAM-dependent methyltransferase [Desulforhopalus singaporensis]|uniref:Methyltransferase domain-containing protein n=1 Tax=Desulforhopalus singaporensis TaxID=91360 RepID=A0A1H0N5D9_9BACT|nr:class I SAM-dependent methyltransferase [Desulforhopalus singaporensis]SDO87610.1 Methyltransferase domain-containing protein [Desulforhopalus singaporensis]